MNELVENARKTKIVWSFESDSLTHAELEKLNRHVVDAIRLVYDPDESKSFDTFINDLEARSIQVPIMVDLAGRVRATVADLTEAKEIKYGESLKLTPVGGNGDLCIKTKVWDDLFREGTTIFLGYGNVLLETIKVSSKEIEVKVIQGGMVHPKIEVHIPATRQVLTEEFEKQIHSLLSKHANMVDFVVVPAIISQDELAKLKKSLDQYGEDQPWMMLKVNSEEVVNKIDPLLDLVDGIFISRLDMGLTVDAAMVPIITKELIQAANEKAKIVVVASEMLGSMRHNATPTRAEVSDIANAVRDGADAVVVSEEVAHGPYAERAAELIDRIVLDAEQDSRAALNWKKSTPTIDNAMDAVAHGAYLSAERMNAKAIVCITKTGNTALSLSAYGAPIPIISVTFSNPTKRRLAMIRGVQAMRLTSPPSIDEVLPDINDQLVRNSWLEPGDRIVFVSVTLSPISRESSNLFTIQRLNEKILRSSQ